MTHSCKVRLLKLSSVQNIWQYLVINLDLNMNNVWAVSLSIFRFRFADEAERRLELSVEWKRTLANNPRTKDCNWLASQCPTRGQHSGASTSNTGHHSVQRSRLVAPVNFRFTPDRRMHYLCVAYYLCCQYQMTGPVPAVTVATPRVTSLDSNAGVCSSCSLTRSSITNLLSEYL